MTGLPRCKHCRVRARVKQGRVRLDLAHVRSNLRGVCASHNAAKGARLPDDVMYPDAEPRRLIL
jgi:hypothetical protein